MSRLPWRWILSGIGALLIAALVWIFGPLLTFLEDIWPRAAIVAVIALRANVGSNGTRAAGRSMNGPMPTSPSVAATESTNERS